MSSSPAAVCPLCQGHTAEIDRLGTRDAFEIECELCGRFSLTGTAFEVLRSEYWRQRWKLVCGQTRSSTRRGIVLDFSTHGLEDAVKSAPVPRSPLDVMDKLLVSISERARPFSKQVSIEQAEYLDLFLDTTEDLVEVLGLLAGAGYVSTSAYESGRYLAVTMTLAGWERVRLVNVPAMAGSRAFVAMSFAPEFSGAWIDGIKSALQGLGFLPIRVDELPHLEKIDDRIIAELRQCDLVVADFSGHRQGVYFEAGFALGRGVPVVWCCHKNDVEQAHFDTRQYNHVTWETAEELHDKLLARIRATFPLPGTGTTA